MYQFDVEDPWKYYSKGPPLASSVERGAKKSNWKFRKVYMNKGRKAARRKNAAYSDVTSLNLVCCDQGCLLRVRINNVRQLIQEERQKVFVRPYNEQNYVLSKLLEVKLYPSGYRRVRYKIPTLGYVCKVAFTKCYGISNGKVQIILNKIDCHGICVAADQRGRHGNNPRKMTQDAREKVTDFILSQKACESHYRRAQTQRLYFESQVSMRQMWGQFVKENPDFCTNRLGIRNKGPVISYSAFRKIFIEDLSKRFSFRKPREDTCQVCDMNRKKVECLKSAIENGDNTANKQMELQQLQNEHEKHIKEAEVRFASLKYDMLVLSKKSELSAISQVNQCNFMEAS